MIWIAWKMLTGNRGKYLGIILGIAFAALLIAQQASIFCGLLLLTTSQIQDITGADIWVMDSNVQFIDDVKPMSDNELMRVRGVPGVDWAVRLYKGLARARFLPDDTEASLAKAGKFQQVILLGLDDATMVGAPRKILLGSIGDLRRPDAIIMDVNGYHYLWPHEPYQLGRTFEMNDRRAVLVGICEAGKTFQTFPIIYTRYSQAVRYAPPERKVMSFILANPEPGLTTAEVCRRITDQTGLKALSRYDFKATTIIYYLKNTGIPINFGITVLLGFIVGTAISGQTFYLFTVENLRQFGTLKAMGASNMRLVLMILFHAAVVGAIGYGLGVGAAAGFGTLMQGNTKLAFFMPWWLLIGTAGAIVLMVVLASLLSIRRVLVLEPAVVFQG
ncbi:MAG: FtsX-like permease family protein [Planctomycetes bacterium]|nr:FtsX-like permease family protein [Planctomycetota bacterium]